MSTGPQHGRQAPRRRVLKSGRIEFSGSQLECVVRSLSDTGAGLEISSPLWFPDSFALVVDSDGLNRNCQVAWRKGRRVGVTFF